MIIDLNIRHYRDLLKSETEPSKRRMIAKLLAEEEVKLASLFLKEPKIRTQATRANGSVR
jgi:hypothetical protein